MGQAYQFNWLVKQASLLQEVESEHGKFDRGWERLEEVGLCFQILTIALCLKSVEDSISSKLPLS